MITTENITPTKSNCGAKHCNKKNVFYSILNGNFVYFCHECKKWINKNELK